MTADTKPNDLLLLAGKVLAILMQAVMAIGAAALVVALPALLIFREKVASAYAAEAGGAEIALPLLQLAGVLALALVLVVTLFFFFDKLRRIIGTVGDGDPFAPVNARRLSMMGWLMLGVQLLIFPLTALGLALARYADEIEGVHITVEGGWDFTGILLVIILFILARVFRHGAAMREDLEGTV